MAAWQYHATFSSHIMVMETNIGDRENLRKPFAFTYNVHNMFNWLSAFIIVTSESLTGCLEFLIGNKPVYENATQVLISGCHHHDAYLGPYGINIDKTNIGVYLLALPLCMVCLNVAQSLQCYPTMPGHIKKTTSHDPDHSPWLVLSDAIKAKNKTKPYDPKKSVWVPNKADGGYLEGLIESKDGAKVLVNVLGEVKLLKEDVLAQFNLPKLDCSEDMANLTYHGNAWALWSSVVCYINQLIYTYSRLSCIVESISNVFITK